VRASAHTLLGAAATRRLCGGEATRTWGCELRAAAAANSGVGAPGSPPLPMLRTSEAARKGISGHNSTLLSLLGSAAAAAAVAAAAAFYSS